jgi:hypothetical protein
MSTTQSKESHKSKFSAVHPIYSAFFALQQLTISQHSRLKELQRTIAVSRLDEISQGPLFKVDILKKKKAALYHCERNIAGNFGYADRLLAGRYQFEYFWEKEEIESNGVDCSTSNQPFIYDLVLSTMCSRDESVRYLVGRQFTVQSIKGATQKGHAAMSETTLFGQAQLVLKNWKKALASGAEFLPPDGSLCSGMDSADYFNHVLKEMYHHLNVTTTITAILDDSGDNDDAQPPITGNGLPLAVAGDYKMPESYFFPGFVSFVLFGPYAHDKGNKSILLQTKDWSW